MTHEEAREVTALIRRLIEGYTRFHKALKVQSTRMGSLLHIDVAADERDYPFLIGRLVQNLSAMTTLCTAIGNFYRSRVVFNLERLPKPAHPQPPIPFAADPLWKPDKMRALLEKTIENISDELPLIEEVHLPDTSQFNLRLDSACADSFPRDVQLALGMIFHMIGKMEGRKVHMNFTNEDEEAKARHALD
jgi:hypothetical protein